MYAHEKSSDFIADQCLTEMFPKKRIEIQESDVPCIIFCVFKKFGIMNTSGAINLDIYRKHLQLTNDLNQRTIEFGSNCLESAEATQHKQDVCKKARVFNDCTHLFRPLLMK